MTLNGSEGRVEVGGSTDIDPSLNRGGGGGEGVELKLSWASDKGGHMLCKLKCHQSLFQEPRQAKILRKNMSSQQKKNRCIYVQITKY